VGVDKVRSELSYSKATTEVPAGVLAEEGMSIVVAPFADQEPMPRIITGTNQFSTDDLIVGIVFVRDRDARQSEASEGIEETVDGRYGQVSTLIRDSERKRLIFGGIGKAESLPGVGRAPMCGCDVSFCQKLPSNVVLTSPI